MAEEKMEKPREKYFYIEKEHLCRALWSIATAFIGASLAIFLFAATHRPPMGPMGPGGFGHPHQQAAPCPLMHEGGFEKGHPKQMMPPAGDFRGGHGFKKGEKPGPHGGMKPNQPEKINPKNIPNPPEKLD